MEGVKCKLPKKYTQKGASIEHHDVLKQTKGKI